MAAALLCRGAPTGKILQYFKPPDTEGVILSGAPSEPTMSAPKCRRSFGRVFTISRPTARFCTSNFDLKVRKRTCQQICYGSKAPYLLRKPRFVARLIPIKCFLRKPSPVGSNVASNRRVLQAKRRGDHDSGG